MNEYLNKKRSSGNYGKRETLPPSLQTKMNQSFGMDFSTVKVYRNDEMAGTGMKGLASGNRVILSKEINLNTLEGQAVLGHELSHIHAQSQGIGGGHSGLYDNAALEHQADTEGRMAAMGQSVYGAPGGMPIFAGMQGMGGLQPLSGGLSASAGAPMQASKPRKRSNAVYRQNNRFNEEAADSNDWEVVENEDSDKFGDFNKISKTLREADVANNVNFGKVNLTIASIFARKLLAIKKQYPGLKTMGFVGSIQEQNKKFIEIAKGNYDVALRENMGRYLNEDNEDNRERFLMHMQEPDVDLNNAMIEYDPVDLKQNSLGQTPWARLINGREMCRNQGNVDTEPYWGLALNSEFNKTFDDLMKQDLNKGKVKKNSCVYLVTERANRLGASMDHEIGHYIDHCVGGENDERIVQLYNNFITLSDKERGKKLSQYAAHNIKEFIAESWCAYKNCNPPGDIATAVCSRLEALCREKGLNAETFNKQKNNQNV